MADNETDSVRGALEAAITKHESDPEPVAETTQQATELESPADTPSSHSQPAAPPSAAESPETPPIAEGQQAEAPKPETSKKREKGPSAPIDWTPDERLKFAELPDWAQQRIYQREVHVNKVMQETAEARRIAEQFVRTVEPYQTIMQAEGAQNPLQAVGALLQTAATLQLGTPTQKAQRFAQLAQHYGVDIELLDKSLAGTLPQNPEQDRMERLLNERLAPVNQLLGQFQQAQQQQIYGVQQQAIESVQQMENNPQYEYLDAVRPVMADLLDLAAQRGEPLSLDEAYRRACAYSPDIMQRIASQQMNGAVSQQTQHIQQKQDAASSIMGRRGTGPAATGLDPDKLTLRQMIEAQMGGGAQRI